eukprot:GEMP01091643.1.p1 GENE.GEMP01091643.1~~GEMP01091643.1.p1  ORF type:complete len:132 (-),score=26.80 GEMP01091643.1:55-450(-)
MALASLPSRSCQYALRSTMLIREAVFLQVLLRVCARRRVRSRGELANSATMGGVSVEDAVTAGSDTSRGVRQCTIIGKVPSRHWHVFCFRKNNTNMARLPSRHWRVFLFQENNTNMARTQHGAGLARRSAG